MAQGLLGGVLPAIYSGADQLKRGVYGLLSDPMEQARRAGQSLLQSRADRQVLMGQAFANPQRPFQVTDINAMAQLGNDVLAGELGFAPAGITVFHGSPYRFNQFDLTKMGTGSGNQLYGKGAYVAESPSVASQYMGNLGEYNITVDGKIVDSPIASRIVRLGGDPEKFIQEMQPKLNAQKQALEKASKEEVLPNISEYDIAKMDLDASLKIIDEAKSYIGKQVKSEPVGNLYKVDLPDEYLPNMLDFDRPLAEQSKLINDIALQNSKPLIKKLKELNSNELNTKKLKSIYEMDGADFISALGGKNKAEKILKDSGVYGIKYQETPSIRFDNEGNKFLDSTGEGTSNFVVFDPTIMNILQRNDNPIEGLLD